MPAVVTGRNFYDFPAVTDSALHNSDSRQANCLPAVRAVQGDSETVYHSFSHLALPPWMLDAAPFLSHQLTAKFVYSTIIHIFKCDLHVIYFLLVIPPNLSFQPKCLVTLFLESHVLMLENYTDFIGITLCLGRGEIYNLHCGIYWYVK